MKKIKESNYKIIKCYDSSLTIQLDPTGKGDWLNCVALSDIGLPEDWSTDAYVGLTAATGQLSGRKQ